MGTVVTAQRSRLSSKFSKHDEPSSTSEEKVTVSSAYGLCELSKPQTTYTEVFDTERQEAPSQITSSPW